MPPKKVSLPLEDEVKLAWEVERRPILWDIRSSSYKRADLKPTVWEDIAKSLGPSYTGEIVSARFKNMKDTFMANHRKVRDFKNKSSGSGADDVFKPKWPLYENLSFLATACVQGKSSDNVPQGSLTSSIEGDEGTSSSTQSLSTLPTSVEDVLTPLDKDLQGVVNMFYYDENLKRIMTIPREQDNSESVESNCEALSDISCDQYSQSLMSSPARPCSAPLVSSTPSSRKRRCPSVDEPLFLKRGMKKKADMMMAEAVEVLKDVCNKPDTSSGPPDHEEIFAAYIASRMRAMDPDKKRQFEDGIMQLLLKF